jgi:hypothetical protein
MHGMQHLAADEMPLPILMPQKEIPWTAGMTMLEASVYCCISH